MPHAYRASRYSPAYLGGSDTRLCYVETDVPLEAWDGGPIDRAMYAPRREVGVAISLFSGAGGLDLGAEAAGFRVLAANEHNADAADTLRKNFPSCSVDTRSILDVPTADLLDAAGLRPRQRPDLLMGGPPCTPFSKSTYWIEAKRSGLDPGASLLQEYTRVLREAQPSTMILENVYSLTFNNKQSRPHYDRLLAEIDAAGYDAEPKVLHAADFGVPQARPRLFIIGRRRKDRLRKPRFPEPVRTGTWERRTTSDVDLPRHVTNAQALAGVHAPREPEESVNGQFGHLLPDIPPGSNYLHYTAKRGHPEPLFEWRSRYWSFLLKLDPDAPAPTIQAQPGPYVGPFHWDNRRLREAETKRLFTFPDGYQMVGNRSSIQAQLGNSVPPLLGYRVANQLANLLA
jgi:DNA (cytosine-5)-methyltransferase 1